MISLGRFKSTDEVEIWVSHDMDPKVVDAKIADLRSQGLRVIVYRSGNGDLAELTGELLRANLDLNL